MVDEDCEEEEGQFDEEQWCLGLFFVLPHIILKSISICIDGMSSVEEVQEYDANNNDSNDPHHDHHLAVFPPVLVL